MENKTISFEGSLPFLKHFKTDKGIRFEIDLSQDQYEKVYTVPALPQNGIYKVTVELVRLND